VRSGALNSEGFQNGMQKGAGGGKKFQAYWTNEALTVLNAPVKSRSRTVDISFIQKIFKKVGEVPHPTRKIRVFPIGSQKDSGRLHPLGTTVA